MDCLQRRETSTLEVWTSVLKGYPCTLRFITHVMITAIEIQVRLSLLNLVYARIA